MNTIKVAILGLGTVGTGVYKLIQKRADVMERTAGAKLEVKKILVRNMQKKREGVEQELLTDNWKEILEDDEISVVIEVMGGLEPAKTMILEALEAGKNVVSANKDLIAEEGHVLLDTAQKNQVDFLFEAAVAGGIPIIRPLKQCLAANDISEIVGIVNGTTNYILTKMTEEGMDFADALKKAQELGFAEADPTADVEGLDAGRISCTCYKDLPIKEFGQVKNKFFIRMQVANEPGVLAAIAEVFGDHKVSITRVVGSPGTFCTGSSRAGYRDGACEGMQYAGGTESTDGDSEYPGDQQYYPRVLKESECIRKNRMTGTEKDCAGSVAGKEWKRTEENGGVRMERRSQPIGFMIKQINNVFEKELNEKVKKLGLTSSQCAVLDYLFHTSKDEISQRDVERHLSLKNPTVTGLLKRLDEKGYILCVPNAKDKRKKNIYLTEKAYDIQRRMEAERRKLDRELTRGMSKREVDALMRNLEKLLYNVADP